jgi:hypothetical protein
MRWRRPRASTSSILAVLTVIAQAQRAEKPKPAEPKPAEPEVAEPVAAAPKREQRFRLDEASDTPLLSKATPMDNAKAFARDRLCKDGTLATYYYHGDWWQ